MDMDYFSQFKISFINYLKSFQMNVDHDAIKCINQNTGDILLHCGKFSFESNIIEKVKNEMMIMKVDNIIFQQNKLIIKFDRIFTFTQCFQKLLNSASLLPSNTMNEREKINFIYDVDCSFDDLTNFRILTLVQTLRKLSESVGYDVTINEQKTDGLFFTSKSNSPNNVVNDHQVILCGPVLNFSRSSKEKEMTVEKYKKAIKIILLKEMESRNSIDINSTEILADAVIKFELLRVKASSPVMLNLSDSETSFAGSVIFVLYNYSRLNAIIHEFETRTLKKYYPPLPPVELIDFSLLKEEKEWTLIFHYVLQAPVIMKKSVQYIREGKPSPHLLCTFLFGLARTFSSYYRSTKILLEARPALIPVVFARICLTKAVHRTLFVGLDLMNVKPIPVL